MTTPTPEPTPDPKPDTPPNPAPELTPEPDPKPAHTGPSRDEFDALVTTVGTLAASVAAMIKPTPDTTPLDKGPWLYRGAKKTTTSEDGA